MDPHPDLTLVRPKLVRPTPAPKPSKRKPAKRGRGRPSKFTPEARKIILDTLRNWNFREVAAEAAGVKMRTFLDWLADGEKAGKGPKYEFAQAVMKAEQDAEKEAVAFIRSQASADPKHAQWWLERKFPARWARRERIEHSGSVGIRPDLSRLTDAELTVYESLTLKALPAESGGA